MKKKNLILGVITLLLCSGCSTFISSRSQKSGMMANYFEGNYKGSSEVATSYAKSRNNTGDELMWRLEEGSAKFASGDYKGSIKDLERAEKIIYDFEQRATVSLRDYAAEAGTFLTTPNTLPYRGNYSEKILLNAYKALDYMGMGDMQGAQVEIRRAYERQKEAEKRFDNEIREAREEAKKKNFDPEQIVKTAPAFQEINREFEKASNQKLADFVNPFVSYLSAISYLYDNNIAEATVDFRRLYEMEPKNKNIARNLVTCLKATGDSVPDALKEVKPYEYPLNTNIVYVIYANGVAPARKERKIQIPVPIIYTGVAFPVLEYFKEGRSTHLNISIPKTKNSYKTEMIADMNTVFGTAYTKELPLIITRMVIAAASRDAGQIAMAVAMRNQNPLAQIAANLGASAYKYAFNRADLRSWQGVAGEFQAVHFPYPEKENIIISNGTINKTVDLKNIKNRKMIIIYVKSPKPGVMDYRVMGI